MAQNARSKEYNGLNPALPNEAERAPADRAIKVGQLIGSGSGEENDDVIVPGGWAGTDDDASTAPSDRIGLPEGDRLSEITGGAISDRDPIIVGSDEGDGDADAVRSAEDRILDYGRHTNPGEL